jgi:hypothetical protein
MINQTLLALRFEEQTGCGPEKALLYTQRYIQACAQSITQNYQMETASPDMYAVGLRWIQDQVGDLVVKGHRYYAFQEFQKFRERIIVPIHTGSKQTGKLTMAKLNYTFEDILVATGTPDEMAVHIYSRFADKINNDEVDRVAIDMSSLNAYIQANRASPDRLIEPDSKKYDEKKIKQMDYNLRVAVMIYKLAEFGDGILTQVIAESEFGRKYYSGPNLQAAPKIVRHAALGDCYEYDLENNVFAWKYTTFERIAKYVDSDARLPYTLEYLDHKKAIRRRLCRDIFGTEDEWAMKAIKQTITAIGFGAPARATGYRGPQGKYVPTALNTCITSVEKLQKFLDDAWVAAFVLEQQQVNDIIFEANLSYSQAKWKTVPDLVDAAGRLRKNSVISYMYQHSERAIMADIEGMIEAYEPLLLVHDCIYTRRPIPLVQIREMLRDHSPYYKIDKQFHKRYAFDPYGEEHRAFIAEEERLARGYLGTGACDIAVPTRARAAVDNTYISDASCADGSGYNGSGYENYNTYEDLALQDIDETERRHYQISRDRVMQAEAMPKWLVEKLQRSRNHAD